MTSMSLQLNKPLQEAQLPRNKPVQEILAVTVTD